MRRDFDAQVEADTAEAKRCKETHPEGGFACEVEVGRHHMHGRMHKGGGHVWVTPPKCERCGDSGTRPAEMGCFGVKRWERCHCDAGDGRDARWPGILKRLAEAVSVAGEKSKPRKGAPGEGSTMPIRIAPITHCAPIDMDAPISG